MQVEIGKLLLQLVLLLALLRHQLLRVVPLPPLGMLQVEMELIGVRVVVENGERLLRPSLPNNGKSLTQELLT